MVLTKCINVTSLYHLVPVFAVLSAVQYRFTMKSIRVVDEIYLHNSRANLLFNHFFSPETWQLFKNCHDVNQDEKFWLPNFLNPQQCNYIKFGANSIGNILTSGDPNLEESMLHQLEKMERYDRKFVYYLKRSTLMDKLRNPLP